MPSTKTVKAAKSVKKQKQTSPLSAPRRSTRGVTTDFQELTFPSKSKKKEVVVKKTAKKTKAVAGASSSVTIFPKLIKEVEGVLSERRHEQEEFAKAKKWSYDPRAPVNTKPTLHDLLFIGLGKTYYDDIVDTLIKLFSPLMNGMDANDVNPFEEYCGKVSKELKGNDDFLDEIEAFLVFGINRLFHLVPANYCLGIVASAGASPPLHSKEAITKFLKSNLDLNRLVAEYPHVPYFMDITAIESATEEDPRDEDEDVMWSDKFDNHMVWLFDRFEERNCNSIGRILAAFGFDVVNNSVDDIIDDELLDETFGEAVLSKMAGSYWHKLTQKCSDDDDHLSLKKRNHILRHAILTAPMNYRTFTGTFCYNVHESDYQGTRSSILEYCCDDALTFFKPAEFIVCEMLGYDVEEEVEHVVTSTYYIPGLAHSFDIDSDCDADCD